MKSIQLTLLALLFTITANAQSLTRGIQVTVYDTVQIVPDKYEIIIHMPQPGEFSVDSTDGDKSKNEFKSNVEKYLKKLNLKYQASKTFGYSGETDYYKVTLLNKEYHDFQSEFRNSSTIRSAIVKKESKKIVEFEKTLNERLIAKARSRGEQLSRLSGLKASSIANIKEVPYNQTAYSGEGWSVYPPLSLLNYTEGYLLGDEYEMIVLSKGLEVLFLTE